MPRYTRIDLENVLGMTLNQRQMRMQILGDLLTNRWKARATGILRTTLNEYKRNIMVDDTSPDKVEVVLLGTLPNLVERGMGPGGIGTYGPYDVRKYVLPWKNPRTGRVQDHVAIPFRRTKSDIGGLGGAMAVAAAEKLAPSRSLSGGRMRYGGRLPAGMAPNLRPRPDVVGLDVGMPTVRPAHATDPLAGMIRQTAQYSAGGAPQAQYVVFRMMSLRGKPWISPGVRPRNIVSKIDVGAAIGDAFRVRL